MVSRFVEQQHVWFFQQQAAQRDAAAFTTGEILNFSVPVRQTQGVSGTLKLHVQVMTVVRLNDLFKLALLRSEFIEVGVRLGVLCVHFIQTFQRVNHFGNRFFHGFTNSMFRVQFWFLRQVTDFNARLWASFTFDIGINAGHDAQQGRFTRAVQTKNTDFGAGGRSSVRCF